jgi:predicted protein tyrosine phosphatase
MIKRIHVVNRRFAELLCSGVGAPTDEWIFISVYNNKKDKLIKSDVEIDALKSNMCKDHLSLQFWDITKSQYEKFHKSFPGARAFSKKDAKSVIDFLKKHHNSEKESVLIVHCDAGVSRSGAIGWFACKFLNVNRKMFLHYNKNIFPNKYILKILENMAKIEETTDKQFSEIFSIDI